MMSIENVKARVERVDDIPVIYGMLERGDLRFQDGEPELGIEQMERAVDSHEEMGAALWRPWLLGLLAYGYEETRQVKSANQMRRQTQEKLYLALA